MNLRKRTRTFLKTGKEWSELLGCDIDHFKAWLQFNFDKDSEDEMTFDNYGKVWELDHVYPCSKFDLTKEDEKKKAFRWENILPVPVEYNRRKNDDICEDDLNKLKNRLKEFNKKLNKKTTSTATK
jgi:hypothetical protein